MLEIFELAKQAFIQYVGNGYQIYLLGIVILLMLYFGFKDKINKLFMVYLIVFVIVFFCPITAKIIMDYCVGRSVYWRMMWVLPVTILLAYYFTRLVTERKKEISKVLLTIAIVVLLANAGGNVLSSLSFSNILDISKVPGPVGELCAFIQNDADQKEDEEIYAVFPNELVFYIRQVNANIHIPYGRDVIRGHKKHELYDVMSVRPLDVDVLTEYMEEHAYDYLVYMVNEDPLLEQSIYEHGYIKIGEFSNYSVFYLE